MSFLQLRSSHTPLALQAEPTVTTQAVSSIIAGSATGNGTLVNLGGSAVTERGFVYSSVTQNPTLSDTKVVASGTGTGAYTASLSGLGNSATYYCRAYATNAIGTAYGDMVSFVSASTGFVMIPFRALMGVGF